MRSRGRARRCRVGNLRGQGQLLPNRAHETSARRSAMYHQLRSTPETSLRRANTDR